MTVTKYQADVPSLYSDRDTYGASGLETDCRESTLRICHLIASLSIGGAERQVLNLLNALRPQQAFLIVMSDCAGELASQLHPGVTVVRQPVRWKSLPVDLFRLVRALRTNRIDVLQTHMYWANLYGTVAGRLAGVSVLVTTEHGKNEKKSRMARWMERNVISRLASRRICVSEDIRRLRHTRDGIPLATLCIIPNGTPGKQQKLLQNRSPLIVGSVGRLVEAKDFGSLIDSIALLNNRKVPVRAIIVGDGPEKGRLQGRIKELGLGQIVSLAGQSGNVSEWLDRMDIYVVSSIREGQPLSLLEAMAVGLPIVATAVGGIPETVADGRDALLVQPGDPEKLANAIQRLALDFDLRKTIAQAARTRQVLDFSTTASLRRHLQVYDAAIRAKGTPTRAQVDS